MRGPTLLDVDNLSKYFEVKSGMFSTSYIKAVDGVSFTIGKSESFGVVGESGSGKTTLAYLIMRLIEPTSGAVRFSGSNIFVMNKESLRKIRRDMGIIFQNPSSSLDPKMRVRELVSEPLRPTKADKNEMNAAVERALSLVNIPLSYLNRYPDELSGGEKQRVGIARAIVTNPKLVIADEPMSALDVSTQAQILELMKDLIREIRASLMLISHDLAVVKYVCSKVLVMYMGKVVERGSVEDILENPLHAYTRALISAFPEPGSSLNLQFSGTMSLSGYRGKGCVYNARCPSAKPVCFSEEPQLRQTERDHFVACSYVEAHPG